MLFNSIEYLLFLPVVFLIYWALSKRYRLQNILLLIASYVFYGWWDWRFLTLIAISSLTDFILGRKIYEVSDNKLRKFYLSLSLLINLGILGFFKYYNFFVESAIELLQFFNLELEYSTLNIILPVGISFYTFQTLSYTIDIYRKEFAPTKSWINFFVYVSFFPQLVAGPIERAAELLPQFERSRQFKLQNMVDGMRQILWGMFKKVVIADNVATHVNYAFDHFHTLPASLLFIAVVLFSIQIYCDFSAYSDIAIGTARLLGFHLMQNFDYPYFSKNISELWRRWHISLSTWLRDYLYTPLSIQWRNFGAKGVAMALMVTFVLCGLWHGARWTYISFGFLQGVILIYEFYSAKKRRKIRKRSNLWAYNTISIFFTFIFWQLSMLIFRSPSMKHFFSYSTHLCESSLFDFSLKTLNLLFNNMEVLKLLLFIPLLFGMEYLFRNKLHALELSGTNVFVRYGLYLFLAISILLFAPTSANDFIYFQF